MLVKQATEIKIGNRPGKRSINFFLLLCTFFIYHLSTASLYGHDDPAAVCMSSFNRPRVAVLEDTKQGLTLQDEEIKAKSCKKLQLTYYLYIKDFAKSFIEIPTANVVSKNSTLSSKYLAGRAPVYNKHNKKVGTCSASFLCMKNKDGIYTDISNFLSVDNGLIVTWFTPTTLINL